MNTNQIISEAFYCIIGIIFIAVGMKALRDNGLKTRITTAAFWFILAFTFIAGPYLPYWITGICILVIAALTAFNRVQQSKSDVPAPEVTRKNADKMGYKVFLPALILAFAAVLAATYLPFGANNAIGISLLWFLKAAA